MTTFSLQLSADQVRAFDQAIDRKLKRLNGGLKEASNEYLIYLNRRWISSSVNGFPALKESTVRIREWRKRKYAGITSNPRWSARETDQLRKSLGVRRRGNLYEIGFVQDAGHRGSALGKSSGKTVFFIATQLINRGWQFIVPPPPQVRRRMVEALLRRAR